MHMKNPRKLLRIATAGSVDDGKSTLIGRLLYDTNSLPEDRLQSIVATSKRNGYDYIDLSLATDGLVAEREQGITIDVAHLYFNTERTNFIVADTPGHAEYTRNMVTGCSNADVAIVLIDARKGLLEQSYRHLYISSLLRIEHLVVVVNKMDLVNYDASVFQRLEAQVQRLLAATNFTASQLVCIPVSALKGENISENSDFMPWYQGQPLLSVLESLNDRRQTVDAPLRFQVQTVIRPKTTTHPDFRGIAGRIATGKIHLGDPILVLPSGMTSSVKAIHVFNEQRAEAHAGTSITLELDDDLDVSRGALLVHPGEAPENAKRITAEVCHMSRTPLVLGKRFLLQHGTTRMLAKLVSIDARLSPKFEGEKTCRTLELNDLGRVTLQLQQVIYADRFADNRYTGRFILIDEGSNETSTVGFIVQFHDD